MTTIATISELLELSGAQYRVFDMGRKTTKLSKALFTKVELNQLPYPYPAQGHAFIALAFWQKQSIEPYLWFIKLPLDERGLLNQGARNHFIAIIIEALGSDLSVNPTQQQEELLKANPYHFTPAGYKLSGLNSILKVELKQAPSQYFEKAQQYFSGQLPWTQWQELGIQGLHDFAARINTDDNSTHLANNLARIPNQVLFPLCIALENYELSASLVEYFITARNASDDDEVKLHLARALSSSINHHNVRAMFQDLIEQGNLSAEWLITLSGRCWELFTDQNLLLCYLELLAKHDDKTLFPAIFKDLVAIPTIKPNIFVCMRLENRSEDLAKAIGSLFNQQ